jgi:hypothetical protein
LYLQGLPRLRKNRDNALSYRAAHLPGGCPNDRRGNRSTWSTIRNRVPSREGHGPNAEQDRAISLTKAQLRPPAASVVLLRFPAALQFFHSVRPATMPARIVCNSPNRRWASEGGALRDGGRLSPRRDHALGRSRRSVAISGVRSTIIASTCAVLVAPAHDRRPRDETRSTAVPA